MNNIESAIKYLLDTKPFYANFFLNSRILFDRKNIATAGATITVNGPVMIFNRDFLSELSYKEVAAVVEHETLHILFEHVYGMPSKSLSTRGYTRQLMNVAMDLSINQYIEDLPKGGLVLQEMNTAHKLNMLPEQTWYYYYNSLKSIAEEQISKYETLDDHDAADKLNDSTMIEDSVDGVGKEVLRSALDEAIKSSKGNVPAEVMRVFTSLQSKSKVDWKQMLSNFVASATSTCTRSSRKKINRRFDLEMPGKVKKRELTLGVCVDSSGSISDVQYDMFMAEIVRLAPLCTKVYLVEADCVVHNVTVITKGKPVPLTRKGSGGTAYTPAIQKCVELKCDAIIYFGDFDASDYPNNPGKPFLWVGVGVSPKPGSFGREIRI